MTPEGDNVVLEPNLARTKIRGDVYRNSKKIKGVKVNLDDLRIRGGHKCHATFAGEGGDLIVLLDEVNPEFVYLR